MRKKSLRQSGFCLMLVVLLMEMEVSTQEPTVEVKIGVVLDELETVNSKSLLSCIRMSLSDFYVSRGRHYKTKLILHARDSSKYAVGAAGAALDLIKNVEVQAILGPATSTQANFVIQLGEKSQVPIISFTASSPALSSIRSPYFFLATQNDKPQVNAISATFQASGWREAVPIYVDNEYGVGIIPYIVDALQAVNARIPYHIAISPSATDEQILDELYKLMTMQSRVFILHMLPSLGTRLLIKATEVGMMSEGYVWIMTDGMTNLLSWIDRTVFDSIDGVVLGVQPYIPKTKDIENFEVRWGKKFHHDNPDKIDAELDIYGLWAYDAITALAMAAEKAGITDIGFDRKANLSTPSTDLERLGVSRNGLKLAQALSNTSFKGLSGDYLFVNQQLQPLPFHVININDVRPRGIELWTPSRKRKGRKLQLAENSRENYRSNVNLKPRDLTFVVKDISESETSRKRLRIAIPKKEGFLQFVDAKEKSGFCIEIFNDTLRKIPNAPDCELTPYPKNGDRSANYNQMVDEVVKGEYDGAVGDISIIASRSRDVDFTLPFMESGFVNMIVTAKERNKTFDFLKPLSWQLWVTSISFFVFIGFVVWFLEHGEKDTDFEGSISSQFGTSFWFAFSLMVFANREKISKNLTRVVVIVSCFVILILTQSYTASLSNFLALHQYQAGTADVHELINNNSKVGYQEGSFVHQVLTAWGFNESNLRPYSSAESCSKMLLYGHIAAAFEETPFVNLILQANCSKFDVVEPKLNNSQQQFQTVGFGFVFQKGSLLAPNISRQIVELIENQTFIKNIRKSWSLELDTKDCSANGNPNRSNILGLESFKVLFGIAGGTALVAVLIHGLFGRNPETYPEPQPGNASEPQPGNAAQGPQTQTGNAPELQPGINAPEPQPPTDPDHSIMLVFPGEQGPSSPDSEVPNLNVQTPESDEPNIELPSPNQEGPASTETFQRNN